MIIVSFAFSYKRTHLYDVWLVMDIDNAPIFHTVILSALSIISFYSGKFLASVLF